MNLRFLEWDSAHFGLRIGRVIPTRLVPDLSIQAITWAKLSCLDCMYLLADADDPTTLRLAAESGWRMVDIRVTLSFGLADVGTACDCIRPATIEDVPYLKALASRAHRDSRFYVDGNFAKAACDDLFATWIEQSVRDRNFAGAVLVPDAGLGRPAGYITCAIRNSVGRIGLIAVDEAARRMGLGRRLLAASVKWFADQSVDRIFVATQGRNTAALRMYQQCQFSVESVQLWFHWWRGMPLQRSTP